jgi:hypothetical protein
VRLYGSEGLHVGIETDGWGVCNCGGYGYGDADEWALRDTVVVLAGSIAEARYTRRALAGVLQTRGDGDLAHVRRTYLWTQFKQGADVADKLAADAADIVHRLVWSEWGLISDIADVLQRDGVMTADHPLVTSCEPYPYDRPVREVFDISNRLSASRDAA